MTSNNEIKTFLADIERSISEIFDFLPEKRDFLEFQKEWLIVVNYLPKLEKR